MSRTEDRELHGPAFFGDYVVQAEEYRDRWLFTLREFAQVETPPLRVLVYKGTPQELIVMRTELYRRAVGALTKQQKLAIHDAITVWKQLTDWSRDKDYKNTRSD